MDGKCIVIITTVNEEKLAEKIALSLVEKRLVACVNIVPKVKSIYFWEDKIQKDEEILLIIKTKAENFKKANEDILKHHPYSVPEVISFQIAEGNREYLNWILDTVKS